MLLHKLALRMGRTVSELTSCLTVDEWTRWLAYARTYPLGDEERDDILMARLCSVVVNSAGVKKRGGGHFSAEDFIVFKQKNFTSPLAFLRAKVGKVVKK
jgi:hypothetical protein